MALQSKEQILEKHKTVEVKQSSFGRVSYYNFEYLNLTSAGLAMEEYASEWKAKYDELKCNHEITNAEYSKLLEGYTALKQQHQQLKDRAESYEKVLKDIAKQHKSSEWEQEGDTEYAYDYIINLARKSLPGKEGKV